MFKPTIRASLCTATLSAAAAAFIPLTAHAITLLEITGGKPHGYCNAGQNTPAVDCEEILDAPQFAVDSGCNPIPEASPTIISLSLASCINNNTAPHCLTESELKDNMEYWVSVNGPPWNANCIAHIAFSGPGVSPPGFTGNGWYYTFVVIYLGQYRT
jgi:hypothetical protein